MSGNAKGPAPEWLVRRGSARAGVVDTSAVTGLLARSEGSAHGAITQRLLSRVVGAPGAPPLAAPVHGPEANGVEPHDGGLNGGGLTMPPGVDAAGAVRHARRLLAPGVITVPANASRFAPGVHAPPSALLARLAARAGNGGAPPTVGAAPLALAAGSPVAAGSASGTGDVLGASAAPVQAMPEGPLAVRGDAVVASSGTPPQSRLAPSGGAAPLLARNAPASGQDALGAAAGAGAPEGRGAAEVQHSVARQLPLGAPLNAPLGSPFIARAHVAASPSIAVSPSSVVSPSRAGDSSSSSEASFVAHAESVGSSQPSAPGERSLRARPAEGVEASSTLRGAGPMHAALVLGALPAPAVHGASIPGTSGASASRASGVAASGTASAASSVITSEMTSAKRAGGGSALHAAPSLSVPHAGAGDALSAAPSLGREAVAGAATSGAAAFEPLAAASPLARKPSTPTLGAGTIARVSSREEVAGRSPWSEAASNGAASTAAASNGLSVVTSPRWVAPGRNPAASAPTALHWGTAPGGARAAAGVSGPSTPQPPAFVFRAANAPAAAPAAANSDLASGAPLRRSTEAASTPAAPAPSAVAAAAPAASPAQAVNLNVLAERVTRIIVRQFEIERERRGGRRWW